ncbi:MAG TPA: DUF4406 domain-containing protein [Thermoclostridium sp.]|nr:DUF4406 domain-containing protein [Thermoclostridium sp.]
MIIYLAGKITGDNNYKAKFKRYELKYRLQGYTVLNPAILPNSPHVSYDAYMRMSKAMLKECDIIVMLPDYKDSKGALQELEWALLQEKEVIYETR